ncbi:MAG TPA: 50S ribosomal protein L32 [Candidatus Moranbacteria bacterium]|jgi:large subunit ribosomal protein L32|nr:50S ribosomal protein L32 [Candidatus Moranbacteria bacterium]HPX94592.1 50S ribosomal protein L32 [Candidatus Moranbacteria bacterium]HQB59891.1 50S ribosomal protein L32 [Candidatus Moranbacteria bacterium]
MSVQKQRHTKLRRDRKRKRFAIKPKKTVVCPKCGKKILSHRACPYCGFYKGKEVINTLKKKTKKK